MLVSEIVEITFWHENMIGHYIRCDNKQQVQSDNLQKQVKLLTMTIKSYWGELDDSNTNRF